MFDLKQNTNFTTTLFQLSRYIFTRGYACGLIKAMAHKLHARTANRTNINLVQKYCWHTIVDSFFSEMWEKNTGLCEKTCKTFGELVAHFWLGLTRYVFF